MCIRDRGSVIQILLLQALTFQAQDNLPHALAPLERALAMACLLYTSDAADERSSVDLGGRRIIKKKKNREHEAESDDDNT